MCNLNIIIKRKGLDCTDLLCHATAHSYADNHDSEGIYLNYDHTIIKSKNKINIAKLRDKITESTYILDHTRISTSGHTMEYAHPFSNDRFVLIHNGIFKCNAYQKSDTSIFFEEFNKAFESNKNIDFNINRIKDSISAALKNVNYGSYSVFIYDKVDNIGYYFKSYPTNIVITQIDDGALFITTSNDNLYFLHKHSKCDEYDITTDKLYYFKFNKKGTKVGVYFVKMGTPSYYYDDYPIIEYTKESNTTVQSTIFIDNKKEDDIVIINNDTQQINRQIEEQIVENIEKEQKDQNTEKLAENGISYKGGVFYICCTVCGKDTEMIDSNLCIATNEYMCKNCKNDYYDEHFITDIREKYVY